MTPQSFLSVFRNTFVEHQSLLEGSTLEFDMMPKLVAKAPEIYSDLAAGIRTNISLNEVIKLGWSALEATSRKISRRW